MRALIFKTGEAIESVVKSHGDFEDLIIPKAGLDSTNVEVLDVRTADSLPPATEFDAVFVTGSAHAVHDREPFVERALDWLRDAAYENVPTLGICFGHQLMATALGGKSDVNPRGREIGMRLVERLEDDPLFEGLPGLLHVYSTHMDAVLESPPGTTVLARNDNSDIQALSYGGRLRSVQWHPEFDAEIIQTYLRDRREAIDAERGPGSADALELAVEPLDTGERLLRNFVERVAVAG